jgi:hypothetical protein
MNGALTLTPKVVDIALLHTSPTMQTFVEKAMLEGIPDGMLVSMSSEDPVVVVGLMGPSGFTVIYFTTKEGALIPFGKHEKQKAYLYGKLTPNYDGFRAVNLDAQKELANFSEEWARELLEERVGGAA